MAVYDQNRNRVAQRVRRVRHVETGQRAWAKTMWFGGAGGCATNTIRVVFPTRAAARAAWIDDWPQHSPLAVSEPGGLLVDWEEE